MHRPLPRAPLALADLPHVPTAGRVASTAVIAGALLARPPTAQPGATSAVTTAVTGVTVIDVARGARLADRTVVVQGKARVSAASRAVIAAAGRPGRRSPPT